MTVRPSTRYVVPGDRPPAALWLERLELEDVDWDDLDSFDDRLIFQTPEWLQFLLATQPGSEPVVAAVMDRGAVAGYFTGLVSRRFGVTILGSPFPGWTTGSMGFNLRPETSRRDAVKALLRFAFGELRCLHVELKDLLLSVEDVQGLGFEATPTRTFDVDLRPDEDKLFASMTSACRRAIRKSEKEGVRVEEARGLDYASEYHAQLTDVFAKQSLRPMYGVSRVEELIRHLEPTGRLLLLRARAPDGTRIATSITLGMNGRAYFWGGASWRAHQILRPNEALFWYAMRYWKNRGMDTFDLGGGGEYKRKFGSVERGTPFLRKSRFRALMRLRDGASQIARLRQRSRSSSSGAPPSPADTED